jgi:hypothetical protein
LKSVALDERRNVLQERVDRIANMIHEYNSLDVDDKQLAKKILNNTLVCGQILGQIDSILLSTLAQDE